VEPHVPGQLAERLRRYGLQIGRSAWPRTCALARDAASGAWATCIRAGLNKVYFGWCGAFDRVEDSRGKAERSRTRPLVKRRES
jgi:hypothetical protein